jgi:hypothetical protein
MSSTDSPRVYRVCHLRPAIRLDVDFGEPIKINQQVQSGLDLVTGRKVRPVVPLNIPSREAIA